MEKILIISLGSIGKRHLKNTRELLPNSKIGVLRLHHKNSEELSTKVDYYFFDIKTALEFKPHAVIIASPANDHVETAIQFLNNSAHVFIEKPLALNSTQAKRLLDESQKINRFAMVGYVLRFQPIMNFLRTLIIEEEMGSFKTAFVEVGQYLPDWRPTSDYRYGVSSQKHLGGGVLLELSHEIDYATWFFGKPNSIFASADKISDLEMDVEDSATLILENKNKNKVVINLDFLQRSASMFVKVVGTEATMTADLINEEINLIDKNGNIQRYNPPKMQNGNEMYLRQFDYFFYKAFANYNCKFQDTKEYDQHVSISDAFKTMQLIDLARESDHKGIRINVE